MVRRITEYESNGVRFTRMRDAQNFDRLIADIEGADVSGTLEPIVGVLTDYAANCFADLAEAMADVNGLKGSHSKYKAIVKATKNRCPSEMGGRIRLAVDRTIARNYVLRTCCVVDESQARHWLGEADIKFAEENNLFK